MKKKQVYNPYLPLYEYIPDGEPHVFGDRLYVFGSHDKEGGDTFCMLDYVTWSAPVDDLSDWRYDGIIYKAEQDPLYDTPIPKFNHVEDNESLAATEDDKFKLKFMYAPDVVQGNDGRYYLYYCMSSYYGVGGYTCPISVAVADSPAGPYAFHGFVRNPDGSPMKKYVCFDPAVINDDGVIRLYYGTQYDFEERDDFSPDSEYVEQEMGMFGRTKEEILGYPDSIMGAVTVTLKDDMLTIADEPRHIIPYKVKGTDFEGHPFFEASSIRKVGRKYYFVYSSQQNHELCYAVSDSADCGFSFGGTIVSNGDVGMNGRKSEDRLNMTGTTHGSIVEVNGQWYVFYHRLTHKSDYSRQGCAEKITIKPDGSIDQVEITSCGLNGGPLKAEGCYPAAICCVLTNGNMPHGCNRIYEEKFPNVSHGPAEKTDGKEATDSLDPQSGFERFVKEIDDGTLIGYRYFEFDGVKKIRLKAKGEGSFEIKLSEDGESFGSICVNHTGEGWGNFEGDADIPDGVYALYFLYHGKPDAGLYEIGFPK